MHFSSIVVPSFFAAAVAAYAVPDTYFSQRDLYAHEAYPKFAERVLYAREAHPAFEERDFGQRNLYARAVYSDLVPRGDNIYAGGSTKGGKGKTTTTITSDGRQPTSFHGPNITKVQTWSVTSEKKQSDTSSSNRGKQVIDGKWHNKRHAENLKRELFARAAKAYFDERDAYTEANFEERDAFPEAEHEE